MERAGRGRGRNKRKPQPWGKVGGAVTGWGVKKRERPDIICRA